jgi:hypothetical protein
LSTSATVYGYPGTTASISSNGNQDAIVWTVEVTSDRQTILHACDATDLSKELYSSTQAGTRDAVGPSLHFLVPTVVNGRVYVACDGFLTVLGPLP